MTNSISLKASGHAASLFLAISFTLCVGFGLLFPAYSMFPAWQKLLPGFHWIGWGSFSLGLIESYSYGWYAALILVPIYNLASRQRPRRKST